MNPLLSIFKDGEILNKKDIIEWVTKNIEAFLGENGLELYNVDYLKEGSNFYLRVFIDKTEGNVGIDDCEIVTKHMNKLLDKNDPIKTPYILEVCSPGIDRPLKKKADYIKYAESFVDVKLYSSVNGIKEFTGKLLHLDALDDSSDDFIVKFGLGESYEENSEFEIIEVNFKNIALCKLAVIF